MAKCNLGKVKSQATEVSGLLLKYTWSVGWPQGPLLFLWLALHLMRAFWADLCGSVVEANLAGFWLPALPSLFGGSGQVRWVFFTEFLQCDSASWRVHTAVVPTRMVAMGTSLLCLRHSGSHPTLKALVSKLIYWRWVLIMDAMPLSKTVTLHVHNLTGILLGSSRLDTQQLAWGQLVSCAAASLLSDPANFCFRFSVRMS